MKDLVCFAARYVLRSAIAFRFHPNADGSVVSQELPELEGKYIEVLVVVSGVSEFRQLVKTESMNKKEAIVFIMVLFSFFDFLCCKKLNEYY